MENNCTDTCKIDKNKCTCKIYNNAFLYTLPFPPIRFNTSSSFLQHHFFQSQRQRTQIPLIHALQQQRRHCQRRRRIQITLIFLHPTEPRPVSTFGLLPPAFPHATAPLATVATITTLSRIQMPSSRIVFLAAVPQEVQGVGLTFP